MSKDVDTEIIPKRGLFSKIQSLILFVTKKGSDVGEWASVSKDPKGYMPEGGRYVTVKEFTKDVLVDSLKVAKKRLQKNDSKLVKPFMPADAVLLAKFVKTDRCSV